MLLWLIFLGRISSDGRADPVSLEFLDDQVAEAGIFGGGISFCFLASSSFSFCAAAACARCDALEELLFQVKLSFRRREIVEAGVGGSSELEVRVDGLVGIEGGGANFGL